MKFRFSHYLLGIICGIVIITICIVIHSVWYEVYGSGIVGTANSISDIPYANKVFKGLNAKGPYTYGYKIWQHNIKYVFTGQISENNLRNFCRANKGWRFGPLLEANYTYSFDDLNIDTSKIKDVVPNIPKDLNENNTDWDDLFFTKSISAYKIGGTPTVMYIYFLKNEERFVIFVSSGYQKKY